MIKDCYLRLSHLVDLKTGGNRTEFARRIGVKQQTFNTYFSPEGQEAIKYATFRKIAETFAINLNWLILGIGEIERSQDPSQSEAMEDPAPYGASSSPQAATPRAEDIRELVATLRQVGASNEEIKRAVLALVGAKD